MGCEIMFFRAVGIFPDDISRGDMLQGVKITFFRAAGIFSDKGFTGTLG